MIDVLRKKETKFCHQ